MIRRAIAAVCIAALAGGCGGNGDGSTGGLTADTAWARPTPENATDAVAYLTLTSDVDDALIEVTVPDEVAASAALHYANPLDETAGHLGHLDGDGHDHPNAAVATDRIDLTANTPLVFQPGASYILLTGLARPLLIGDQLTFTLALASGRSLDVSVTVSHNPPPP